ncbi:LysR substrate-binding domain-containing protein [Burkholderia alba]|uniref:LysR substrate-binding domain-containing protein n=1 Tax=Burkholderia alba TaxID=2683677 RepID=UPI002B0542B3|nr:LysR substrate-binding domain-containing protein [Burkholderia alba]
MKAKLRPNLAALRALEAAIRHRSFTLAAAELHVTHSAISHQVRQLEAALGHTLFIRVGLEMQPTPACRRLGARVRHGLDEIDAALEEARAPGGAARTQLSVSAMTDFAHAWLIPRLAAFADAHPDLDLALTLHHGLTPPDPYEVDAGIWHQRVGERGFRSEAFARDRVIAVCSPAFASAHGEPANAMLATAPLLHFASRSWEEFLVAAGLEYGEPRPGPSFADAASLLSAALAGLGIAMIRERVADAFLRGGALVRVGDVGIPAHLDYFFVWHEGNPREAAIRRLHRWLADERAAAGEPA